MPISLLFGCKFWIFSGPFNADLDLTLFAFAVGAFCWSLFEIKIGQGKEFMALRTGFVAPFPLGLNPSSMNPLVVGLGEKF